MHKTKDEPITMTQVNGVYVSKVHEDFKPEIRNGIFNEGDDPSSDKEESARSYKLALIICIFSIISFLYYYNEASVGQIAVAVVFAIGLSVIVRKYGKQEELKTYKMNTKINRNPWHNNN